MKTMGILSDTHVLFRYGLVPPAWQRSKLIDNCHKYFSYVWECWDHFVQNCPELDILVHNGDAIHGEDPKDRAYNVISANLMDQARAYVEVMRPLRAKADKFIQMRGTKYHEEQGEALEFAAKELDAEIIENRQTHHWLNLEWEGHTFNVTHHQTAGWLWLSGGMDRMAMFQNAAENAGEMPQTDVLIRSHLHQKRIVRTHGKWVVSTPGWTLIYPWLAKKSELSRATQSNTLGAIVCYSDDGRLSFDDESFAYPTYKEKVHKV